MHILKNEIDFQNVISVVLLEQTQLFKNKNSWGLSVGANAGNTHSIVMSQDVPSGTELKFSVTFKDGSQKIVKAISGSETADRLLQMALDPAPVNVGDDTSPMYELKKNQLPNGEYVIGKDIPAGIYDFTLAFGNGSITKFKEAGNTTLGATQFFQWMGSKNDYEYRQCLNINCKEGEVIVLQGNIVVDIAKSKKIEIDL